ncbi:MAG: hypothetical protein HXX09_17150 [Bacteroidetes bacterium]|nr:hypothetical protein [Bacteroidota bacterium]
MRKIFTLIALLSIVFTNQIFAEGTKENSDTLKNAIVYQIQVNNGNATFSFQIVYSAQSSPKHLMQDISNMLNNADLLLNAENKDLVYLPNSENSQILNSENLINLNTSSLKTFIYKGKTVEVKKYIANSFSYNISPL